MMKKRKHGSVNSINTDYTGCSHQKKKRGFKLQKRKTKEWERSFFKKQSTGVPLT